MKTVPILLPDDLHKQFRDKLYQDDRTSKEFFLTAVRVYVEGGQAGPKKEDEKPKNPDSPSKVHNVNDPIEPEAEDKKPKEKIDDEKRPKTGGDQPRGKEENGGEGTPPVPRENGGGDSPRPGP
ncbi:unnamed protein product, partial [marine sediment metagenome]